MSTSTSDPDMSDCSNSPMSYMRDSPHSSPSQQVPQLTNDMTELSCGGNVKFQMLGLTAKPFLRITEQPQSHFRFRYISEMVGTHGCLLGRSTISNKPKTHPTVELVNYSGQALIKCHLAQHNNYNGHPHKLLDDDQDKEMSYQVPDHGSYKVGFGGIGIIHTAKKDVAALLFKKEISLNPHLNHKDLQAKCENIAKSINLNIVRLKFSAHDPRSGKEICEPVLSEPIHNMKSAATNELKICRMSRTSGSARGGEDVFIFVEKVNKKNIMIRFFELGANGERTWEANGKFMLSDVHHQYGIVFRTPPYQNPDTPDDVNVYVELCRPLDGQTSEPKDFKYKANHTRQIKKRKTDTSYCSIGSSSSGSLRSITGEIPVCVDNNLQQDDIMRESNVAETSMYLLPQPQQTCDLGNALFSGPGSDSIQSPMSSPMWGPYNHVHPSEPPMMELQLKSGEMDAIANNALGAQEIPSNFLTEYLKSYGESFPDGESLPDGVNRSSLRLNSMGFINATLVTDSGRAKKQEVVTGQMDTKGDITKSGINKRTKSEYPAFYKTEDGLEVKKLVKELCEIMRNKSGVKKQEIRNKLEKLFDIRLSNGDTFLHMTLCSEESSLEYIVKIIHSVRSSHLLDCVNNKSQTTLHLAIAHNMPKIVALLVAKGANPMLKDEEEMNAIHYAVKYNSCLEILLDVIKKNDVPCDINDYNNEKQSALHMAVVEGSEKNTRLLLQHGASYSVRDTYGRTPLHLAAYDSQLGVVKALIDFIPASEIDVMDGAGNTALQIVCGLTVMKNTVEIARILLGKKASPLKTEGGNESAWRLAKNSPQLKELMKEYVGTQFIDEDDIKSEPEDEYESADDLEFSETGLQELSSYSREVSVLVDNAGAWRALARRLRLDQLTDWYAAQPSPTFTLLNHLKESRDDITSKSLAMILEDIDQKEAAAVIRRYID